MNRWVPFGNRWERAAAILYAIAMVLVVAALLWNVVADGEQPSWMFFAPFVFLPAFAVLVWAGHRRHAAEPGAGTGPAPATPVTLSVVGGLRARANATWPMARLDVLPTGLRVGPSTRILGPFIPTYWFTWGNVERITVVNGFTNKGIEIVAREPVIASSPGMMWPERVDRPCFWIQQNDIARVAAVLPEGVVMEATGKRRWL